MVTAAVFVCLFGGWVLVRPLFFSKVYAGVAVEGVDIGGKSREEVRQILSLWQDNYHHKNLKVYYGDTMFMLDAQNIDFDIDVNATLDDIWNVGRHGPWWERLKNIHMAAKQGYRVPVHIRYNDNKFANLVDSWRESIDRPPRNAALSLLTGGIVPQEPGRRLEVETLRATVLQALKKNDVPEIPMPVTPLYPDITVADIKQTGIKAAMGIFTTEFNNQDANRASNLKLAARKINGTLVYPGQTFSFNEVVGPRDKESGFKEALEIVDNEMVPGIGGGICQVSSTLYNAVLLANLPVTERYNHSKPLGYVSLGRDATVAYGVLDFKFMNNTGSPLMIMAETEGNELCVGIFGPHKLAETVQIVSEDKQVIPPAVIKKQDSDMYLGETKVDTQGKPGYEVTTVRVVKSGNTEIKREVLSKDRYLAEDMIVKIGTKMPPFAQEAAQPAQH